MKNPWDESIFCWWTPNVIRMFAGSYRFHSPSLLVCMKCWYTKWCFGVYTSLVKSLFLYWLHLHFRRKSTITILGWITMFCWLNPYLCWLKPSFCWLKSKPHFLLVKSLFPLVKTPFSGGYLPRQVGKDSYCGLVQCSPVIQVIGIPPALYKWGLLHIIANWFVFFDWFHIS